MGYKILMMNHLFKHPASEIIDSFHHTSNFCDLLVGDARIWPDL